MFDLCCSPSIDVSPEYFVLLQAKPYCDEAVVVREDEGGGAGGGDGEDEDQHGEDGMEKSASG